MEKERQEIDNIKYPDNDSMELFLSIGKELHVFETLFINVAWGKTEEWYKTGNAIHILAVITEYLQNPENNNKKQELLLDIKNQPKGNIYRKMADMVLKIWLEKNNTEYVRQRTQIRKNKLWDKQNIDITELPIVPEMIFPARYKWESNVLVDKLFQEKLIKEKQITEEANIIEKNNYNFIVPDDWLQDEINDLKSKL